MKIKINEKNRDKIEKILNEVQRQAKVRMITVHEMFDTVNDVTLEMSSYNRILKKDLHFFSFRIDINHQEFPNAYKWEPLSTQFWITYNKAGEPLLTDLKRFECDKIRVKNITFFRGKNYDYKTEKNKQELLLQQQRDTIYNGFLRAY